MIGTIITFIIVLSVIVFVHELGHFYVAIKSGVKVEEFGFGFPPRLWGYKKKDTIYSINAIPIGGFVRLKGESGQEAGDPDSFAGKPMYKRALIIAAGVIMNIVLAWFLFSFGYVFGVPQLIENEGELPRYAKVSEEQLHIVNVLEASVAESVGLQVGDIITEANGNSVTTIDNFSALTSSASGESINLLIDRAGEPLNFEVTPSYIEVIDRAGVGVSLMKTALVSYPVYVAPFYGAVTTVDYTYQIVLAFGGIIKDLFTGRGGDVDVSGPIGIAVITGEVAESGWRYLLQFVALLSINLGVINILPLPALDGGRLLFLLIEKIRGKAVSQNLEAVIHNTGFALLLLLIVVVTYGDVMRFGDKIMQVFIGGFAG